MRIKRYEGSDIQEVLQRIKSELGRDAVILHSQRLRKGGFLGLGAKLRYEVLAATDLNTVASPPTPSPSVPPPQDNDLAMEEIKRLKQEIQSLRASLG
jgi:flagellar biosynthesis protein FlhF